MLRIILATAVIAAASASMAGSASAGPSARVDTASHTQVSSHDATVQNVHWERRGHRRVWVPDHRRYGRGYDRR